jgi:hypothetical protein
MATLLVEYDLRTPGKDYASLIAAIQQYPWCHHLRSAWFVKADLTPTQLAQALRSHVDASDALVVLDATNDAAAWYGLAQEVDSWIKANV